MQADPRDILKALFQAAVDAADPALCLPQHLPAPPARGRTVVVGAGKAAAAMARAVEQAWPRPLEGVVITRYGHGLRCERIEVIEAAHPVPDAAGEAAARRIHALAAGLGADDLLLCLLSGGGSSLLALPAQGLTLADKRGVAKTLLRSGASISEINCVRKHMSEIKGGRLALAAWPAQVVTLAISDVPGDDPSVIASGPTTGDPTTLDDALALLERYEAPLSDEARAAMQRVGETPKPGDPRLPAAPVIIARPQDALEAAAAAARAHGYHPLLLGDALEGEAREVGIVHAGIAASVQDHGHPLPAPCVLLSGGETTVTVRGQGRGGRSSEFLLSLAAALKGRPGIFALAADTDGIDGSEENAGALIDPQTLTRGAALGLDARALLEANNAYGYFAALGDLVTTGPTRTNVNDFRAVLIEPCSGA